MRIAVLVILVCAGALDQYPRIFSNQLAASSQRAAPGTNKMNQGKPVPTSAPKDANVPETFRALWKQAASDGQTGEHAGITYRYAVSGERAAAVMTPRPIPRDDALLVGTISDLARRAFKADLSTAPPRLEPTPLGGNAIAFSVGRHKFLVLTIKNETREGAYGAGEPHTLLLWRERR